MTHTNTGANAGMGNVGNGSDAGSMGNGGNVRGMAANGARMAHNQPTRTNHGGNQSRGGNYGSPGGNETGTMQTQMNAGTTSGQPDNSELSRFMNNGGGPEPHQGSNPGAQSDPGPKEIGFYDKASDHMGGDDGVQAAVERPSPMRMGGVGGSQPNAGQRGGQNTGTSGSQTTAYSSDEEYGAATVTGAPGATSTVGDGSLDSQTRNPVGFAATFDSTATQPSPPSPSTDTRSPGYTGDSGSGAYEQPYQSRAAQMLVDMRDDSPDYSGAGDGKPRAADKAGEVADAVKDKAGGFFARTRDRMEDFLTVDLNNDGSIGSGAGTAADPSYSSGSRMEPQGFETREKGARTRQSAFEPYDLTHDAASPAESPERGYGAEGGAGKADSSRIDDTFATFYGKSGAPDVGTPDMDSRSVAHNNAGSQDRSQAKQRELVDA